MRAYGEKDARSGVYSRSCCDLVNGCEQPSCRHRAERKIWKKRARRASKKACEATE